MYADSPVQVHILIILNYIYAVDIKLTPSRSVSLLLPHLHLGIQCPAVPAKIGMQVLQVCHKMSPVTAVAASGGRGSCTSHYLHEETVAANIQ